MTDRVDTPEATCTPEELRRYARQLILPGFGLEGQRRLKEAKVLVIGAGGLGSPVLLYLASVGVGTIGIIDDDTVEVSNLHRQIIHSTSSVGEAKTRSAARRLTELNPLVTVVEHQHRLNVDTAIELFSQYDLVLDGADSFATRYLVSDAAEVTGRRVVWGSLVRFGGQVTVFAPGSGPGLRDIYPEPPEPGEVPSCAEGGVIPSLCGIIGSTMANEAIKILTGIGDTLLGRVMLLDAASFQWTTLRLEASPDTDPRRHLEPDYEVFCGITPDDGASAEQPIEMLTANQLAHVLDRPAGPVLVDVREPKEIELGRIPGALSIPLGDLSERAGELAPDDEIVVYCQSGVRSERAVRQLRQLGFSHVSHLDEGFQSWLAARQPMSHR
ncbi:MAG: adenylyltransferase/sulfurtransferase MoeZ [Micrococcus sp.]|nr:adenylyltransferase/sulfurtransferase MoeZ [Micrococcus sp.]